MIDARPGEVDGRCPFPAAVWDACCTTLISHIMFLVSFCRSQLPPKIVNLSFTMTNMKNELTDLCGNQLLHDDCKTLCEINAVVPPTANLVSRSVLGAAERVFY